jgi:hypothetical protein
MGVGKREESLEIGQLCGFGIMLTKEMFPEPRIAFVAEVSPGAFPLVGEPLELSSFLFLVGVVLFTQPRKVAGLQRFAWRLLPPGFGPVALNGPAEQSSAALACVAQRQPFDLPADQLIRVSSRQRVGCPAAKAFPP